MSHGEFLITMSVNEKVKKGRMQVSSIVICKPNTHPSEIPYLKAVAESDKLVITSLAHKDEWLQEKNQWIDVLKKNSDALECKVLVTTLTSLCTKLSKKDAHGKPQRPLLKTTTITGFDKAGMSLADDYFAVENGDVGELELLPIPYNYDKTVADADFKYAECMVIWRAYIAGTEDEVEEEKAKEASGNAAMDRLTALMKGTKIS